jgi:hypothetical protein
MAKSLRVQTAMVGGRRVFVPADPLAEELLSELPLSAEYNAVLTGTRGIGRNPRGKYWAGLAIMVDNFDSHDRQRWPSSKSLHRELLVSAGFSRKRFGFDGKSFTVEADTELWDGLTNAEIDAYLEQVRMFVSKRWGYDPWAQWEEKKAAEKHAAEGLKKAARDWMRSPPPSSRRS